ncbi:MAG: UDP-2,3-diacylglucosamine pyrophosphatase [Alphaproteobacteria bacterium]|jgi:DUF1009 family protein|nr:UDP-2,3-diacylglucosamine pyrophosphatase [Alphaproteobacteria bacterium]PPR12673.1 MAG: hypothetical protein CFH42_02034 [Alphaproteobacteria bacterium MarineAlpha12_Bin1]|tara:strand:- start:1117 stop:1962 length:846 start_codon:yes stop_codon:yes gene_type:complete
MAVKLGILAGGGSLPAKLIDFCKQTGRDYFVIAFEQQADPEMIGDAPHSWVRLGAAGEALKVLREESCKELVLAGPIKRPSLSDLRPDRRAAKFISKGFFSKGDDGLLSGIIKSLEEEEGFKVIGVDSILGELIAGHGNLGVHFPNNTDELDIIRGVEVLYTIGLLDIGQSVVISQEVVLAVEAAEGTEEMLIRCKSVPSGGNGGVLIKLPKPRQEKRVDMPAIGPRTVIKAKDSGLSGIAVAANLTLIIEPQKTIQLANKEGIFIVGLNPNDYKADYMID